MTSLTAVSSERKKILKKYERKKKNLSIQDILLVAFGTKEAVTGESH